MPLGYGASAIRRRLEAGRLHRVYRGVYAVGHRRLSLKGRWMAAVLACGPKAVLSHRAGAALWDLRSIPSGPIDITVPGRTRRGQTGIRVHNVRRLHPADRATRDGIPVTAVPRTLLDYAEVAGKQQLRHALDAAVRMEVLDGRALDALLARCLGRRGRRLVKAAVAELRGPAPWTQSELERAFLALIREDGLPEPRTNVMVAGYLVDMWWPEERLVVELDGYRFHKSRKQFEEDRLKDAKLLLEDCRVLRVTQRRVQYDREALLGDVEALLAADVPAPLDRMR
jgi:very-short-patch-repair endonuclease